MASPYIEQAAERARLPISVGIGGWNPYWIIWNQSGSGHPSMTYGYSWQATRAYVQLRSKLEDGQ